MVFVPVLNQTLVSVLHEGIWGLLVNAVVFIIVSLCTAPPSEETRTRFTNCLQLLDQKKNAVLGK